MDRMICSIIVLNHNGRDLLKRFMPSVLAATEYDRGAHEVIIVDNASSDGSQEFIQKNFPAVRLITLPSNRHMDGYNKGIQASRNEIVVILNNDIEVERDFLQYLLPHFRDPSIFAVRPTINVVERETVKETRGAQIGAQFKFGFIEYTYREAKTEEERELPHKTFCAPGGAGAFNKKKFLELNGFDELFAPFYWEDVDLCYRAWKRGWQVIYEPRSVIYHYTHTTIGKLYKRKYIELISLRNRYLLVWKNISHWAYLIKHLIYIPLRMGLSLVKGSTVSFLSFFHALRLLKKAMKKRKSQRKHSVLSDREVFGIFNSPFKDRSQ